MELSPELKIRVDTLGRLPEQKNQPHLSQLKSVVSLPKVSCHTCLAASPIITANLGCIWLIPCRGVLMGLPAQVSISRPCGRPLRTLGMAEAERVGIFQDIDLLMYEFPL